MDREWFKHKYTIKHKFKYFFGGSYYYRPTDTYYGYRGEVIAWIDRRVFRIKKWFMRQYYNTVRLLLLIRIWYNKKCR